MRATMISLGVAAVLAAVMPTVAQDFYYRHNGNAPARAVMLEVVGETEVRAGRRLSLTLEGAAWDISVVAVGQLPAGVALEGNRIAGIPTAPGTYAFAVEARGAASGKTFGRVPVTVTVLDGFSVSGPETIASRTGATIDLTFKAEGGEGVRWTATGLPSGISVNQSTGRMTGRLTSVAAGTATVTARDAAGISESRQLPWAVTAGPRVSGTTINASAFSTYSQAFQATGIGGEARWSFTGRPSWLAADTVTGRVSGTPDRPLSSTMTVTVTDSSDGASASYTASIRATGTYTVKYGSMTKLGPVNGYQYPHCNAIIGTFCPVRVWYSYGWCHLSDTQIKETACDN